MSPYSDLSPETTVETQACEITLSQISQAFRILIKEKLNKEVLPAKSTVVSYKSISQFQCCPM